MTFGHSYCTHFSGMKIAYVQFDPSAPLPSTQQPSDCPSGADGGWTFSDDLSSTLQE